MIQPKKPHPVLDALINGTSVRTDADIARKLATSPAIICFVRSGSRPLGDTLRIKIMRNFGLSIWDLDDLEAVEL